MIGLMFDDFVTANRMRSLDYDKVRRFAKTIQTDDGVCRTLGTQPCPADELIWQPDDDWITQMCFKFKAAEDEKLAAAAEKAKERAKEAASKPGPAAEMAAKKAAAAAAKAALEAKETSKPAPLKRTLPSTPPVAPAASVGRPESPKPPAGGSTQLDSPKAARPASPKAARPASPKAARPASPKPTAASTKKPPKAGKPAKPASKPTRATTPQRQAATFAPSEVLGTPTTPHAVAVA